MTEQQYYWFAARTRDKQEFGIRDSLENLGLRILLAHTLRYSSIEVS